VVAMLGRIVNRFSSDMTTVDENLSQSVSQMTYSLFSVVGALAAIAIATKGAFMAIVVSSSTQVTSIASTLLLSLKPH
jgi:ABC-type multidrug transport system fused ATPase/permease subunit